MIKFNIPPGSEIHHERLNSLIAFKITGLTVEEKILILEQIDNFLKKEEVIG
jgi:hypothetical protein